MTIWRQGVRFSTVRRADVKKKRPGRPVLGAFKFKARGIRHQTKCELPRVVRAPGIGAMVVSCPRAPPVMSQLSLVTLASVGEAKLGFRALNA
jgi:hypothetical protein